MTVKEGSLLWAGSKEFVDKANLTKFAQWVTDKRNIDVSTYERLWEWSVSRLDEFWGDIWEYFDVISTTPYSAALETSQMPGAVWFPGTQVNYAEHILRNELLNPTATVLYHSSELRPYDQLSWNELGNAVRAVATALRKNGVKVGDRVVSYMPNTPETVIAMLATTAIGAIWSSAAPEFGARTVLDRFQQISPKLIFAADGYSFNGKIFDRRSDLNLIVNSIETLETVIWLDYAGVGVAPEFKNASIIPWKALSGYKAPSRSEFKFERVGPDHPLWVLFSSGTTGLPKAIVHSHTGILLEQLKAGALHCNLDRDSTMFFYTTTGWMMWNALMASPLIGGAAVLYDGSPNYPDFYTLWALAERSGATFFGSSPTFVEMMRKERIEPNKTYNLDRMNSVILSGSPSTPETFAWFYENISPDLWVTSQSGGTEFCGTLVGGVPTLPVYAGEIQARALGADIRALDDDGSELIGETGELVVAKPMPSMPLYFWGDENNKRYKEAYFDTFEGLWRHGDLIKINERGGCFIYGRSDSTLNRYGVRIGSAEIYRILDEIDVIEDSLIVCVEYPDGAFYMPLFLQLADGAGLDDALQGVIKKRLRLEGSPRHVPDELLAVPAVPYTLSGKKMEVPVRKLLLGWAEDKAFSRDAMKDKTAMDWYTDFARRKITAG